MILVFLMLGFSPAFSLSSFTFIKRLFSFSSFSAVRAVYTHSNVLARRIPGMGEPGGLPSMGRTESDTTEVTYQQQQQSSICISEFVEISLSNLDSSM